MKRRLLLVLSLVVIVALGLTACGNKSGGGSSGGAHNIGDAVQVTDKNLVITMESGSITANKILTSFTIENKGSADFTVDPATTFQVSATSGTDAVIVTVDNVDCTKTFKAPVPAGGKVTGDVCWRGDPTHTWPDTAVISFGGAATDANAIIWKLSAGQ
jgi:predicted small secreted protein